MPGTMDVMYAVHDDGDAVREAVEVGAEQIAESVGECEMVCVYGDRARVDVPAVLYPYRPCVD